MPNKPPRKAPLRAAGLLLILVAAAHQAQVAKSQDDTGDTDAPPIEAEAGDAEPASPPPERVEEAPIDVGANARPTLDYEPSETISEDSSVSFPVDI